jgi:hypothetical protein
MGAWGNGDNAMLPEQLLFISETYACHTGQDVAWGGRGIIWAATVRAGIIRRTASLKISIGLTVFLSMISSWLINIFTAKQPYNIR